MPAYEVLACEQVKDVPDAKFGPAKVLKLTLKNSDGSTKDAEWFTKVATPDPEVGSTIEGEVTQSQYGLKFAKHKKDGGGGGFKRSPAENKKIVRQHSQEMALRREFNLIASGMGPLQSDELKRLIQWFENDANGKVAGVEADPMTSDVPADMSGTPLEGS